MQLPLEIAMEVGSFLNSRDLTVSTTQLCSEGVKFVARPITNRNGTLNIRLHKLIRCLSSSSTQPTAQRTSAQVGVAQEVAKRIEFYLARRANVAKIALHLGGVVIRTQIGVHAELYGHFQHAVQVQPNQNQAITVEWHVSGASVTDVAGFVELGSATADAPLSEAAVHPRFRLLLNVVLSYSDTTVVSVFASCQSLHALDLSDTQVNDVSALASCHSLHTLNLSRTRVTDVSALALCLSLHTLELTPSRVTDVSALASCRSLHTLALGWSRVTDVSALASCPSLHTLDLESTEVSDVSALASCQSLHTLDLGRTQVRDVSAIASCRSLHTLLLYYTEVTDVSALASSQSLHSLVLNGTKVSDVSALALCPILRHLDLSRTKVNNVAGLAASKSLHTLILGGSKVRDVSALKSCSSLRKVGGTDGMAGHGALLQLLRQRQ
jgi:hypothetical protein